MNCKKTAAGLAAALLVATGAWAAKNKSHDNSVGRNLNIFNTIVRQLETTYVDTIPVERAFGTAIAGLLSEIDPYTEYYTAEERKDFRTMTTGEYGGIGSYIMERDSSVYISGPYEGSPAAQAGLRSGDRILRIDTIDVAKAPSARVSELLRGTAGSTVRVSVARPYAGPDSVLTFDIKRGKLNLPSVPYYGVTQGDMGYIKLTSFMEKSPEEVKKALEEFKANPAVKGIILDLRGNGGGLLESAVEIVNFFVPKGTEVLSTRGRDPKEKKTYRTTKQPILPDMPLAVLIDGGSASASEITAGAMQDLDRGVLIGSRSFGKGLVQSTYPMPDDGMLKITTAKYYIPSGRLIQALDYSRRNPDGTVAATPDSLCNTYKTLHGRQVRDGGGLQPDIKIEWEKPSRLVYNLVRDNWIFDFGTRFAASHPRIADASEFEITDEIYADFKKSIDPSRLKYDKVCEDMLKSLEETAETEGYMNDSTKAEFQVMRKLLTHNLEQDLDTHRKTISRYLANDILGRYYYTRGEIIHDIKSDEAVIKAAETLRDKAGREKLGIRP
ncbi:MAG: S41 family peptidase [Muribaculaceae bacterium]|nr:S41 family peptidase [Muribaculaceae bacterium]